jgi:hypothetical protein
MNREDVLHERLTRLEAGESLEICLSGLAEEEAGLLRLVAALRAVPYPDATVDAIAAQRTRLRRVVKEDRHTAAPAPHTTANGRLRLPLRWNLLATLPRPVALLLAGALVISAIAGALLMRQPWLVGPDVARNAATGANDLPYQVHVPVVSSALTAPDPQSSVLSDARGVVEVQTREGSWQAAEAGQVVGVGQRLRTGKLSSATLMFYDGSQARVGPAGEVSIDELDARRDGPRRVKLTQWIGESDHDVTPSSDAASRYEVRTPSGTGVAKGTKFHVRVTLNHIARFNVDEGSVAVSHLNVSVTVVAGQSTTIYVDQPPTQPVFRISGEGKVTQMGDVWRIGGRDFQVNTDVASDRSTTEIIGNPQLGDWVAVEGRILPDGAYFADRIALLQRAPENRFSFTGTVDNIGAAEWTIAGRAIQVNAQTDIESGIEPGDLAQVTGVILQDGALQAERIRLVDQAGLPFEFTGVVESIGGDAWLISGVAVTVNANTKIETGIVVGDVVKSKGRILADGMWLATDIKRAEEHEREFEFTGVVDSLEPWSVGGIGFETNAQTQIDAGIQVGDRAKVSGRILNDGALLAERVRKVDEPARRFDFVGRVTSTDPWIVGGLTLEVNAETRIEGGIVAGDTVRVRGRILPDGTLLAEEIKRLDDDLGCMDIRVVVTGVNGNRIRLRDGQVIDLNDTIEVRGNLRASAVVIIRLCIDDDDTLTVIRITVIFQLEPSPPPPSPAPPGGGGGDEDDDDDDDDDD